jgi:serine/threonine protein phosphatase PrpC
VYDGHEGSEACNHLSAKLEAAIRPTISKSYGSSCSLHTSRLQTDISRTIKSMNKQFLERSAKEGLDDGSTAVFAVLAGRQALIGNVGNSRALLCSVNVTAAKLAQGEDETDAFSSGVD